MAFYYEKDRNSFAHLNQAWDVNSGKFRAVALQTGEGCIGSNSSWVPRWPSRLSLFSHGGFLGWPKNSVTRGNLTQAWGRAPCEQGPVCHSVPAPGPCEAGVNSPL